MTLADAEKQFPLAYAAIQRQIEQFQHATDAEVMLMRAHLVTDRDGRQALHIDALTDMVVGDSGADCCVFGFRSPTTAPPSLRLLN